MDEGPCAGDGGVAITWSVAVIGAGTAGTATALFLGAAGHDVTLYEKVPQPGPVGAGIVLQPTGQAVLARLRLLDRIVARGGRIDRLLARTAGGRVLVDLQYQPQLPDAFGLGVHRGLLFSVLYAEAVTHPKVTVRTGVDVRELVEGDDERMYLRDEHGKRIGPHDLVVVADGSRSALRRHAPGVVDVRPYEWGALWTIVPDPGATYTDAAELFQVVEGTERMLGMLPCGLGPEGQGSTPLVTVYWSLRGDDIDAFRRRGLADFREQVLRYDPRAEPVLAHITDVEQMLWADYRHVVLTPCHGSRVVFIGDAAHAMSPQLGQGTNLALCDAAVLSDALSVERSIEASLFAFARARRRHVGYYQWATRMLTPFFQSDVVALGWLRDAFMPVFGRVPWFWRRMCASMVGNQTGVLSAPVPVPRLVTGPS